MWVTFWIGGDFNRSAYSQEVTFITLTRNISKNMCVQLGRLYVCVSTTTWHVIITKFCTI